MLLKAMYMNFFLFVSSPLNYGNNNQSSLKCNFSFFFLLETGRQSNKWSSATIRVGKLFI